MGSVKQQLTTSSNYNEEILATSRKLDELCLFAWKIILFGKSPTMEQKISFQQVLGLVVISILLGAFGIYDIMQSLILTNEPVERLSVICIDVCFISFNVQWFCLFLNSRTIMQYDIHFEEFNAPKLVPSITLKVLQDKLNICSKIYKSAKIFLIVDSTLFIILPIFEAAVKYFNGLDIDSIYILEPVKVFDWWYQISLLVINSGTVIVMHLYCIMGMTVLGVHIVKVVIQCEVLCEAINQGNGDEANHTKLYVEDHVKLIRCAKKISGVAELIVSQTFMSINLVLAVDLYQMSMADSSDSLFLMVLDIFLTTVVLAGQCFVGSMITDALESINHALYHSLWYQKGKRHGRDILIMGEMARRPLVPKVWLGTMDIQNPTVVIIIQRSYSYFTLLTVLRGKS